MQSMRIAVLGGTGKQGSGLALRWAKAGHKVIIGSLSLEKAEEAAAELNARLNGGRRISGADNEGAAAAGEVVVCSVPYGSQAPILRAVKQRLANKLVISVVAPLKPPKVSRVWQPEGGSAALEAQALLGDAVPVYIAFQNTSAEHLADPDHVIDSDVLVCGDSQSHRPVVEQLVRDAGMRPVYAGPLANASVVEGMTAVLIGINLRYKIRGAGIRITGFPD